MDQLAISSLSDFVKNATILWLKGAESFDMVMRNSGIVQEISIPQNSGNVRDFSEIDLDMYARLKLEREQALAPKIQQGYTKTGTLYRIAFSEPITYEMRTQGKYLEIQSKLTNLLPTAMARMELDLQHRFTFGTQSQYTDMDGRVIDITTGDGYPLFYTAHTVKGSPTTSRNRVSSNPAFSRAGLESMEKMRIENHINQLGQKVPVADDILWTTDDPNTVNTVRELLQSNGSTTTGLNSGVMNPYNGRYKRHVILPRVATDATGSPDTTKSKYWGVVSSMESSFMLGVHEEPHVIPPSANGAQDILTDDIYFGVRAGYMIVVVSPAGFGFSSGDGT